jgi:polyisoprenoid-binding protein YceI
MNPLARCGLFCTIVCVAVVLIQGSVQSQGLNQSPLLRLEVQSGSKAEYRVREQLARLNFPNDAVGTTDSIAGALVMRPDGSFTADSRLTVDLRALKTDEPKRDGYVRANTLQTDQYPRAEFLARRQTGLPRPLPTSGGANFQLAGEMTLHGVTAEQTWDVAATFAGDVVNAKATTRFNFAKYKITVPRIFGLISVEDDIRLELNVRMRRMATPG